jgi:hypothetical protein
LDTQHVEHVMIVYNILVWNIISGPSNLDNYFIIV